MFNSRIFFLTTFLSFQALGAVTMEEKRERVQFLEDLASKAVSMNVDAYKRELKYEEMDLPLETRAMNEANLLAEKIRIQVQNVYEAAAKEKSPNEAFLEVKEAIEKDIELLDPDLKDEIQKIAYDSLENVNTGSSYQNLELGKLEEALLDGVIERANYLNQESIHKVDSKANPPKLHNPRKTVYKNIEELVTSLLSEEASIDWTTSSNISMRSTELVKSDTRISLKVGVEFLGVSLDAGPSITFRREYRTNVGIVAEGINPILLNNGSFDFFKRDKTGGILIKNGTAQKRQINFVCDASLMFETDYTGSGGFSVVGAGASSSVTKKYSNSVLIASRRILVPDSIGDKIVNLKTLSSICHNDFLKAKVNNKMTVSGSLNIMMKNVVSGLRFSHPKTKCLQDSQCNNWYKNEVIALLKTKNIPRCVEERKEKYRTCELRGLEGQNCAVFDKNGKRLSDGSFEFACDTGLQCVKVRNEGWFQGFEIYQHAMGVCKPINAKTYKSPVSQTRYIQVNFK